MYLYRRRHKKASRKRCTRKNARLRIKNRKRISRVSRGER